MIQTKKSFIPGFILIGIGLWILMRRSFYFNNTWEIVYPILFLLFGGLLIFEVIRNKHKGAAFWGTQFLIFGTFFLLRNIGIIQDYISDEYWPLFLIGPGIGFCVLFFINPSQWGVLIPGIILLCFGFAYGADEIFGYDFYIDDYIGDYWPVILIFIGIVIILKKVFGKEENDD